MSMTLVLTTVFLLYFVFLIVIAWGWLEEPQKKSADAGPTFSVSVVVALRNEESSIQALIKDLQLQQYAGRYQVILVNDHSTDASWKIIERAIADDPRFVLINNAGEGKKKALATGIAQAEGEIIVTTDGDCRVPHQWLQHLLQPFLSKGTRLVAAPVVMSTGNLFSRIQAIEFSSLMGTAISAARLGYPLMCNGANLAFRKEAFIIVNGYDDDYHIPSGDDEFLMRKIVSRFPKSFCFLKDQQAVVTTIPQKKMTNLVHQRLRWAGKWRHNTSPTAKAMAVFIWMVQFATLTSMMMILIGTPLPFTYLLAAKGILELVILFMYARFFSIKFDILSFVILQIVHPLYVLLIGGLSHFLTFTWKGRKSRLDASVASS
jgi:cellulose synthase/poly-beta-1,6-N-acetylglucosamine synthase-like glycosyltransferase